MKESRKGLAFCLAQCSMLFKYQYYILLNKQNGMMAMGTDFWVLVLGPAFNN